MARHLSPELREYIFQYAYPSLNRGDKFEDLSLRTLKKISFDISDIIHQYLLRTEDEKVFRKIRPQLIRQRPRLKRWDLEKYLLELRKESVDFLGKQYRLLGERNLKNVIERPDYEFQDQLYQVFEVFYEVSADPLPKDDTLQNLAGTYVLYNQHSGLPNTFQRSALQINADGTGTIRYYTRRGDIAEFPLNFRPVGPNNLFFQMMGDPDCVLHFLAFIGINNKPEVIQAVYIYNSHDSEPVASLAVLKKDGRAFDSILPKRNMERIEEEPVIMRFLQFQAPTVTSSRRSGIPPLFKLEDLVVNPGPFRMRGLHHAKLAKYCGVYQSYYAEQFSTQDESWDAGPFATIGRGVFHLFLDEKDGSLHCRLKILKRGRDKQLHFSGRLFNHELDKDDHFLATLYNEPTKDRAIQLLIKLEGGGTLLGAFNVMYVNSSELGGGIMLMNRIITSQNLEKTSTLFDYLTPGSFSPLETIWMGEEGDVVGTGREVDPVAFSQVFFRDRRGELIVNFLSRKANSLLRVPASQREINQHHAHLELDGWYRTFTYSKKGIRVGYMRIYPSGIVHNLVRDSKGRDFEAYGAADLLGNNLHIRLDNVERRSRRRGYFIFKTDGEVNAPYRDTIYTGVFAGLTARFGQHPFACRAIIQYIGPQKDEEVLYDMPPGIIGPKSKIFGEIPELIRYLFGFKPSNLVGFLRQKMSIYTLDHLEVYREQSTAWNAPLFQAAVYEQSFEENSNPNLIDIYLAKSQRLGESDPKIAFQQACRKHAEEYFERAVYHGFIKKNGAQARRLLQKAIKLSGQKESYEARYLEETGTLP